MLLLKALASRILAQPKALGGHLPKNALDSRALNFGGEDAVERQKRLWTYRLQVGSAQYDAAVENAFVIRVRTNKFRKNRRS
jgi:hypothetical protein